MANILKLALALAYTGGIFLLSSIPDDGDPETTAEQLLQWATPQLQNLLHIPLFGGLAAVWYWTWVSFLHDRRRSAIAAFLVTGTYAFLDEWHQLHVPGRFGSLTDIVLNLIGIVTILLFLARSHIHEAKPTPHKREEDKSP